MTEANAAEIARGDPAPFARVPDPERAPWRFLGVPLLALLGIEFLLGMALNLFTGLASGSPWAILESNPVLWVHIGVGVLLVGITSRTLVLGIRRNERRVEAAGLLGVASATLAFAGGMWFTFGGQSPVASYVMSVGFTGLLLCATLLLWPSSESGSREAATSSSGQPVHRETGLP